MTGVSLCSIWDTNTKKCPISAATVLRTGHTMGSMGHRWGANEIPVDRFGGVVDLHTRPKRAKNRRGKDRRERERDSIRFFKDHQKIPRCCFFLLFSPVVMEMMFPSIVPSRVHNEGKYQRRKSLCLRPEYSSSPCPDLHPPIYSLNGKKIKLKRPINQWCTQRAEMC